MSTYAPSSLYHRMKKKIRSGLFRSMDPNFKWVLELSRNRKGFMTVLQYERKSGAW